MVMVLVSGVCCVCSRCCLLLLFMWFSLFLVIGGWCVFSMG